MITVSLCKTKFASNISSHAIILQTYINTHITLIFIVYKSCCDIVIIANCRYYFNLNAIHYNIVMD